MVVVVKMGLSCRKTGIVVDKCCQTGIVYREVARMW